MTTIYVRKSGNDTTGNGSAGTPYLTINKALSVAVAGDVILVGAGTYAEDSGSGYLSVNNRVFTSFVTIAPESGERDVIVTGASGSYDVAIGTAAYIWFDNIVFQSRANTVLAVIRLLGGNMSNLLFTRCKIRVWSSSSQQNVAITSAWTVSGFSVTAIMFNRCEVEQIGHWTAAGISLDNSGGATCSDIDFVDTTVVVAGTGVRLKGIKNTKALGIKVNSFNPTVGATAYQLGEDAATGADASGLMSGSSFKTFAGHAAVIGGGVSEWVGDSNQFYGGNNSGVGQGLVFKNCVNFRLMRSTVHGGYNSGLYYKAAQNGVAVDCTIYNNFASSSGLRVGINPENNSKVSKCSVRQSFIYAGKGNAMDWADSAGDAGGSVSDQNVYCISGSASLGNVRGAAVASIPAIRMAWSAYDMPGNDRNSRIGMLAIQHRADRVQEI